jgi:hypothetical protein
MSLEPFQQNTVAAAFRALTSRDGSRRFLIADEVGLGKTISSKSIAQRLQEVRGGPLNVVYLCPNLDIASQNLTKLTALDETWETPPDRLSLAAAMTGKETVRNFRLFSYTPDTSLPGWKAGQRGGRAEERQLISALLVRVAPKFWRRLSLLDERNAENNHQRYFVRRGQLPRHLPAPFRAALNTVLGLPGFDLDSELRAWFDANDSDIAEFILRARAALALVALTNPLTRPHFLILDEFHRYADLILPNDGFALTGIKKARQDVQRLLIRKMLGDDDGLERPALLLMSATPYRLLRVDGTEVEASRYRTFIRLVRFLFGDEDSDAANIAAKRIAEHHASLRAKNERMATIAAVKAAKEDVEAALRPIIARTERATTITGELFDRRSHAAVVAPDDLRIFQHFARAVANYKADLSGWVTTLWSSVPYPAETLFEYKVGGAFSDLPKVTSALPIQNSAHPQIRALVSPDVSGDSVKPPPVDLPLLGLPWAIPTAPWWKLGGAWAELAARKYPVGKALLFSRYIATPLAISALLSLDVQRRQKASKTLQPYLRYEAKTPWPLIAGFMPWPNLAEAFDPLRDPRARAGDVTEAATKALNDWLKSKGFIVASRNEKDRKPWELSFEIEVALDRSAAIVEALRHVTGLSTRERKSWLKHNPGHVQGKISKSEIRLLASWLLSAPGMVIARNLRRHQSDLLPDDAGLAEAFNFCWHDLRPYLGQRVFGPAILPRRKPKKRISYPDALRRAIFAGGFEAVVDEHLAVMRLIGDETPLEHLRQAFFGRAGRVRMRKAEMRKPERVSVHAAVPYAGAERGKSKARKDKKLRSDSLRRAFNSPFWPHLLATTSVGQEGLDFHVWCDRIVHWDLPRDPVDFEQREGRIARYASLCVRRSLSETYGNAGLNAGPGSSPFWAIFQAAREAKEVGMGLERWWSPPNHKPVSITFDLRFSQNVARLKELQEDLTRYRLALGQPEPGLFEDMVKHFNLRPGEARGLALDLSAPVVMTLGSTAGE